jgi:hypothetical protein
VPAPVFNKFPPVCDHDGKRVRGLSLHNNIYCAEICVGSHKTCVRLEHEGTMPQTAAELQVLKNGRAQERIFHADPRPLCGRG